MGSRFAEMRLGPVILALFVLCIGHRPAMDSLANPHLMQGLLIGALVFGAAPLGNNAVSMAQAGRQFAETLAAIEAVPRGSNLVSLYLDECQGWSTDRRHHIMGYGLARRLLFDKGQWPLSSRQLITIHDPALAPFDRDPSAIAFLKPCSESPGLTATAAASPRAARSLWISQVDPSPRLPGWEPLCKTHDSVLYRRLQSQAI